MSGSLRDGERCGQRGLRQGSEGERLTARNWAPDDEVRAGRGINTPEFARAANQRGLGHDGAREAASLKRVCGETRSPGRLGVRASRLSLGQYRDGRVHHLARPWL